MSQSLQAEFFLTFALAHSSTNMHIKNVLNLFLISDAFQLKCLLHLDHIKWKSHINLKSEKQCRCQRITIEENILAAIHLIIAAIKELFEQKGFPKCSGSWRLCLPQLNCFVISYFILIHWLRQSTRELAWLCNRRTHLDPPFLQSSSFECVRTIWSYRLLKLLWMNL